MQFVQKLEQLEKRFEELNQQMANPAVISDGDQYRKVAKNRSELEEVVGKFREWKSVEDGLAQARGMLQENDPELAAMAQEEAIRLEPRLGEIEEQLKVLLLPKDPLDDKNVVLEIRAGTGGDEATLFAAEIFRMYSRYAETQGWKMEITSSSDSSVGGLKEVIALVSGNKVFSKLKYESGVHRVQRVPVTETQGRFTPRLSQLPYCPKPTTSKSSSKPRISASIPSVRPAPAANRSTPPIPPSA